MLAYGVSYVWKLWSHLLSSSATVPLMMSSYSSGLMRCQYNTTLQLWFLKGHTLSDLHQVHNNLYFYLFSKKFAWCYICHGISTFHMYIYFKFNTYLISDKGTWVPLGNEFNKFCYQRPCYTRIRITILPKLFNFRHIYLSVFQQTIA